jgi:hypothetical protein
MQVLNQVIADAPSQPKRSRSADGTILISNSDPDRDVDAQETERTGIVRLLVIDHNPGDQFPAPQGRPATTNEGKKDASELLE